ncbi:Otopetrin-1, partial [Heterocephalus glaber]
FVAGLLFLLAWAVHAAGVGKRHLLSLLTVLMLLQLLWMLWYVGRSYAQRRLIRPKDAHAGARWLRGSVTLFAVITIILGCFKVGYFIGFSECLSAAEGVFPVTHALHTLLQVYFLWGHAKDIIQSFKTLERFGVIHSVFTNLLLWANSVLNESKHQLNEHKARLITLGFRNITMAPLSLPTQRELSHSSLCPSRSSRLSSLSLFYKVEVTSVLLLQSVDLPNISAGRKCGSAVRETVKGVVAVYLVHIGRSKAKSEAALAMFYLYAIALLLLMGAAGLLGIRIYRVDEKSLDQSKNPARKLDADLLVGSASGSWLLSWGSILAIACAETRPPYTWYNLPYSVLAIAEKYIQNLFIIESVHREPEGLPEDVCTLRVVTVCNGAAPACSRPGDAGAALDAKGSPRPQPGRGEAQQEAARRERGGPSSARPAQFLEGSAKKRVLRNITAFLFLCNISLWIPPAFGCRPEYDNGLEEVVFGFEPWIIVVNLAMPFSVFYRMHAAASLFEVYCKI